MHKSAPSSRWEQLFGCLGFGRRKKQQKNSRSRNQRTFSIEPLEARTLLSIGAGAWTGDAYVPSHAQRSPPPVFAMLMATLSCP